MCVLPLWFDPFCPLNHCRGNNIILGRSSFFSPTQTSNFPPRNRSLISHGISTFLMISFDYDKLLNAVIYFCCVPITSSVLLTCVFTPQTNILSDPRFILIAPLCQCLLMIFYRTFSQCFTTVSLSQTAHMLERLRYWSNLFSSLRKLVITQSILKLSQFLEMKQRTWGLFCIYQKCCHCLLIF